MCRKRLSSPRCRSELIDSVWVVIVPGQKCIKEKLKFPFNFRASRISAQSIKASSAMSSIMLCSVKLERRVVIEFS